MNHIAKEDRTKLLQFFRRGVRHVASQGKKSMRDPDDPDAPGQCSYHHHPSDGGVVLRCAIGGGLRMDVAKVLEREFLDEGISWATAGKLEQTVCEAIGIAYNEENITFLARFQRCHDGAKGQFVEQFLGHVQGLAGDYDISFDEEQYA